jgi:pimeloyl-ACP methyl ester carboxylesterase
MWKDFPQRLCDAAGCRGLVYSRPGYGRSTPPCGRRGLGAGLHAPQAHEVLPGLLKALDIDTAVQTPWLFGHSDGASIACCTQPDFRRPFQAWCVLAPHILVEDLSVSSIAQARTAIWKPTCASVCPSTTTTLIPPSGAGMTSGCIRHSADWSIESEIETIRCPLLAVQGLDDEYGTLEQIRGIARRVPQARLLELSDCGHSPHRDQAGVWLRVLVLLSNNKPETHYECIPQNPDQHRSCSAGPVRPRQHFRPRPRAARSSRSA